MIVRLGLNPLEKMLNGKIGGGVERGAKEL